MTAKKVEHGHSNDYLRKYSEIITIPKESYDNLKYALDHPESAQNDIEEFIADFQNDFKMAVRCVFKEDIDEEETNGKPVPRVEADLIKPDGNVIFTTPPCTRIEGKWRVDFNDVAFIADVIVN